MKHFGWMNFLKSVAMTKIFDKPGLNSLESVRKSYCFDVLAFASEDKLDNESQILDMEAAQQNQP